MMTSEGINSNAPCFINRVYTPGSNEIARVPLNEKLPSWSVVTSATSISSTNSA